MDTSVADVALILEGTYPYVAGGVSTWVHQILGAYPERKFALIHIGAHPGSYGKPVYTVPDNVTPVIVAAAWTDAAGQRRTLARPLYRNSKARAWRRLNCGIALREVTCEPERRPGA